MAEEVTIKDIARICGVGVTTVSRAINNHPDINPQTKKKILDVVKEYNYIPNNAARNLKRQESKTIALLIKGISNPFFLSMLKPLEEYVEKEGYDYIIQRVKEDENEIKIAAVLEKEKRLKGIIFLGASYMDSEKRIQDLTTPYVFCTLGKIEDVADDRYSSVAIDDRKETIRIIEYLISLGHKKIAFLGGRPNDISIGQIRLNGYREALEKNGIPFDEKLVFHMVDEIEEFSSENGYEMTKKLLAQNLDVTAVFALSDDMAIGCIRALIDAGKDVPGDYSVAGFDGTKHGYYYSPRLTTIIQPCTAMILESAKILFELIQGSTAQKHVILDATLFEGESTKRI